jgi:hypothetical protein
MAIIRDKNSETVLPTKRKKTTIPPEYFETKARERNKEMLKSLGVKVPKNEHLTLTITSIYKDQDSCYKRNYRKREFYNNKNKLIAKYTDNPDNFTAFVEGYLKALVDNKIKYVINEEVFVD